MRWSSVLYSGMLCGICGYIFGKMLSSVEFEVYASSAYRQLVSYMPYFWGLLGAGSGMLIEMIRQAKEGR